jgi:hypothetical protein
MSDGCHWSFAAGRGKERVLFGLHLIELYDLLEAAFPDMY